MIAERGDNAMGRRSGRACARPGILRSATAAKVRVTSPASAQTALAFINAALRQAGAARRTQFKVLAQDGSAPGKRVSGDQHQSTEPMQVFLHCSPSSKTRVSGHWGCEGADIRRSLWLAAFSLHVTLEECLGEGAVESPVERHSSLGPMVAFSTAQPKEQDRIW
ncbi:hypothetical protein [Acidovorax sp. CCYZU-2555]|uniref:hypothetical protein n=1 Tax=Acidovorax sp. CCYZU-2555 TaxID=2835042 RepID=UPI001BCF6ACD|nr:hypothetical protein [Acidovorax sp. CCYZU-2555]MBS7776642.1 hypothetical protein [Acidovorax sp. CCYZU-2555]